MLFLSKKYYCIKIRKKDYSSYFSTDCKFFACKAKNKKKAAKKFYKKFNKEKYEIEKIYPMSYIKYENVLFCLE